MTMKRLWKNLDEYYRNPAVEEDRRSEFDPSINQAMAEVREQSGIEEGGADHQPFALAAVASGDAVAPDPSEEAPDIQALKQHLPRLSRRGFLQLGGAATVFGMVGCWHQTPNTIVPSKEHPEGHVLGRANYYATTIRPVGRAMPILAKTYEFRPIKLEGNYDCAWTRGRLDIYGQAALLDLYDPDRVYSHQGRNFEGPLRARGDGVFTATSWTALDAAVGSALTAGRVGLITPPIDGPAHARFLRQLQETLGDRLTHVVYDPMGLDRSRQARGLCFGESEAKEPVYHLEQAEVIVSLGSDLLGGGEMGLAEFVSYGDQRRLKQAGAGAVMGSFIAFESAMTQGGTCADLRVRANQADLASIAWALSKRVAEALGRTAELPDWVHAEAERGEKAVRQHKTLLASEAWGEDARGADAGNPIAYTAELLLQAQAAGKHSLIYAGGMLNQGPEALPLLVATNVLNHLLGNEGVTVETASVPTSAFRGDAEALRQLLDDCSGGQVDTLILVDSNPVHALGKLAQDALKAVASRGVLVACNDRVDESAVLANWVAPITHDLESWGDAEPYAGHYCLQQAVIMPLWDVRQWQESLMSFLLGANLAPAAMRSEPPETPVDRFSAAQRTLLWSAENNGVRPWRDYVLEVWAEEVRSAAGSIARPQAFLHAAQIAGFVIAEQLPQANPPSLHWDAVAAQRPAHAASDYTLLISPSRSLRDGRQANNAWLQEAPDPVTKVTWDTWLSISIHDARELMLSDDTVVEITVAGTKALVPVLVQPGQQAGHMEIFTGFGRTRAGAVAEDGGVDGIQVNAFALSADGHQRWVPLSASDITITGRSYQLANTQGHHYMDGRPIAHDDVLALHKRDPAHDRHQPHVHWVGSTADDRDPTHSGHNLSLFNSTIVYPGRRWGMAIDMNSCTGCNACVVACSAENNVPVVGRDEVRNRREMHWIRIDRYYTIASLSYSDLKYKGKKESREVLDDPDDVEVIHQPMMCQQCGHAPCEEVCPAMATMHNDEGLNV
ncbi:MAG: 4Fe-4S dicluster domain-containing protein, partial [Planctomycetota bacterium]